MHRYYLHYERKMRVRNASLYDSSEADSESENRTPRSPDWFTFSDADVRRCKLMGCYRHNGYDLMGEDYRAHKIAEHQACVALQQTWVDGRAVRRLDASLTDSCWLSPIESSLHARRAARRQLVRRLSSVEELRETIEGATCEKRARLVDRVRASLGVRERYETAKRWLADAMLRAKKTLEDERESQRMWRDKLEAARKEWQTPIDDLVARGEWDYELPEGVTCEGDGSSQRTQDYELPEGAAAAAAAAAAERAIEQARWLGCDEVEPDSPIVIPDTMPSDWMDEMIDAAQRNRTREDALVIDDDDTDAASESADPQPFGEAFEGEARELMEAKAEETRLRVAYASARKRRWDAQTRLERKYGRVQTDEGLRAMERRLDRLREDMRSATTIAGVVEDAREATVFDLIAAMRGLDD